MRNEHSQRRPSFVLIKLTEAGNWLKEMYGLGYEVSAVPPAEVPIATVHLIEEEPFDGLLTPGRLVGCLADLAALGRELPPVELAGSGLVLTKTNYAP
jgi:hypothetical protein